MKVPTLICLMSHEEAKKWNMKIIGTVGQGDYKDKVLVCIQKYLK